MSANKSAGMSANICGKVCHGLQYVYAQICPPKSMTAVKGIYKYIPIFSGHTFSRTLLHAWGNDMYVRRGRVLAVIHFR